MLTTHNFEQGSDEWHDTRRGIVTASMVGKLITPALKVADNDTSRAVTLQLVAERITGYTEPTYVNADMERGNTDEPIARQAYTDNIAPVAECGFMVLDGIYGYSPDGLVGDDGLIEVKSRRQKAHLATILENKVPAVNVAQIQMGLMVSGRKWCDYLSWCGGMPMWRIRMHPDTRWFAAIWAAVAQFEGEAAEIVNFYQTATAGLPETERGIDLYEEMRL